MALPLFSFDPSKGETLETLERRRKVAEAMLANIPQANTIGGGLAALGQAIGGRLALGRANRDIAAGQAGAASRFGDFMGGIGGGGTAPPSDVISGGTGVDALAGASGGLPSVAEMEAYIGERAPTYGIDPKTALEVARSEGLQPGTWQSNVTGEGGREPSYGPFQLHDKYMGADFTKATGLRASDPGTWKQGIDFALGQAKEKGWSPWYGAAKAGIGARQGIGGGAPAVSEALAGGIGGDTLGSGAGPFKLTYANQRATRNLPVTDELGSIYDQAARASGITEVKVTSGGQPATGSRRTGSHRHDLGNAGDIQLLVDGRPLDMTNPNDLPIIQKFIGEASRLGAGGIGAGTDYMGSTTFHVGFGTPAVWGAGGKGANAPDWLRSSVVTGAGGGKGRGSSGKRPVSIGSGGALLAQGNRGQEGGLPAVAEALMGTGGGDNLSLPAPAQEAIAGTDPAAVAAAAGMIDPAAKDDLLPTAPAFVPAGGETPYEVLNATSANTGLPALDVTPPMRPVAAPEAPPVAPVASAALGVAPVAQALGVDPLPQTSGLVGPVASAGHESLSPGVAPVADALSGGAGTPALAGGGGRGFLGRLFGPRPPAGGTANPVAAAMSGGAGAAGPAGTPGAPGGGGLSDRGRAAMAIMSDGWQTDEARAAAKIVLEQEIQQLDPRYQLEYKKMQYELAVAQAKDPIDLAKAEIDYKQAELDYKQASDPGSVPPTQAEAAQIERSRAQTKGDEQERLLARERLDFDIKQGGLTPDIKNYEYYAAKERAAGRVPLDPLEHEIAIREAGRAVTTFDQRAESAGDVALAGINAKKYEELQTKSAAAQDMLNLYDLAEIGLQSGGYTGFGASGIQAAQQLAVGLGLYDEEGVKEVAGNELLVAIQNRMALMTRNPDTGMGMPGAVSDRDITFLKAANIGLDQTPEGNRLMLEVGRRLEERKIDIANLYDQWLDGELDGTPHGIDERGFNKAAREWAKENPLFEDLKGSPAATNLPPAPEGVDAEDWKYYTPEQIKLYYPDYKP